jgi:hypothetical protein
MMAAGQKGEGSGTYPPAALGIGFGHAASAQIGDKGVDLRPRQVVGDDGGGWFIQQPVEKGRLDVEFSQQRAEPGPGYS